MPVSNREYFMNWDRPSFHFPILQCCSMFSVYIGFSFRAFYFLQVRHLLLSISNLIKYVLSLFYLVPHVQPKAPMFQLPMLFPVFFHTQIHSLPSDVKHPDTSFSGKIPILGIFPIGYLPYRVFQGIHFSKDSEKINIWNNITYTSPDNGFFL